MRVSCGGTLIKWILFVFNFLWLILGGLVLWLGFTITSWSGDIKEVIDTNMKNGAITILVAGFVIFFFAFLGCCGACKNNSCMLSTYGGIILILVIVQCVGIYFAFAYKSELQDEVESGVTKLFEQFKNKKAKARVVQRIQQTFKCCGITNEEDFLIDGGLVPISCCGKSFSGNPWATCSISSVIYEVGCVEKVKNILGQYLGGLAGIVIALVAVQIIIILMACCLSRDLRK